MPRFADDLAPAVVTTRMQSGDLTFDPIQSTVTPYLPGLAPAPSPLDRSEDTVFTDESLTPTVTVTGTKLPWPLILGAGALLILYLYNKK